MKKIVRLLVLLSFLQGYSQYQSQELGSNIIPTISDYDSGTYSKVKEKVDGSPYLFDSWNNIAVITTKEEEKYKIVNLNYDTKSDLFVVKTSLDSIFTFKPDYLKEVTINNKRFKKCLNHETGLLNYYEVVAAYNDKEILKRSEKAIRIGMTNGLTREKENDYFILKENYFINENGKLSELSLKKKNILKLFGDKSQKVNKFISNNNLSIKTDIDLKKIFKYYESIM